MASDFSEEYHQNALNHHDRLEGEHEAKMTAAKQEMDSTKPGSIKHENAKRLYEHHMEQYDKHRKNADHARDKLMALRESKKQGVTQEDRNEVKKESAPVDNNEPKAGDPEWHRQQAWNHKHAIEFIKSSPDANTSQGKKDLRSHKLKYNHHANEYHRLINSKPVDHDDQEENDETNGPISHSQEENDDDKVNNFVNGLSPEQRQGMVHHGGPIAEALHGKGTLPGENHQQAEERHEASAKQAHDMADEHISDAESQENSNPAPKNVDKQAYEVARSNLHHHAYNRAVAEHNGDKAAYKTHDEGVNQARDAMSKAGVEPKYVDSNVKAAHSAAASRVRGNIARGFAINHTNQADFHRTKKMNLNSAPDKPVPEKQAPQQGMPIPQHNKLPKQNHKPLNDNNAPKAPKPVKPSGNDKVVQPKFKKTKPVEPTIEPKPPERTL